MKFLSGLLGLVVLLLAVSFALANREPTVIQFWPFGLSLSAPLYILTLGTLLTGVFIGALISWLTFLPHRFTAWRLRKDVAALTEKIETIHAAAARPVAALDEGDPNVPLLGARKSIWKIRS